MGLVHHTLSPRAAGAVTVLALVASAGPAVAANGTPCREQIAFVSERTGNAEIFVMNDDGSGVRQLTHHAGLDAGPEWSPDGSWIAFNREVAPGGPDDDPVSHVFVMRADGSGARDLTAGTAGTSGVPTWSPDGTRIAFASNRDGNDEIWAMNADGSRPVNLTRDPAPDYKPSWSPDGRHIVFETYRDTTAQSSDLWVMDADGSHPHALVATPFPAHEWFPQWSHDGRYVAYMSQGVNTTFDVFVVGADGRNPTDVTRTPKTEFHPAWSPDDSRLAFGSNLADGGVDVDVAVAQVYTNGDPVERGEAVDLDLWTMNRDGTDMRRLTNTPGNDADPSYRPLSCRA